MQPDVITNAWHQVIPQSETTPPRTLARGRSITQVYDAADGELLILGAPGAGKTTQLLELAKDLLERAEVDEQHPMPIVFNLSSWSTKQQSLADWLVEELVSKYQVPRKLGQTFVEDDQILPLLDGLDEVSPKERTACIEAINRYRQEHGLLPLVVCSSMGESHYRYYGQRYARTRNCWSWLVCHSCSTYWLKPIRGNHSMRKS